MKLDKIKFAWLIAFVTKHGATLGQYEIEDIDNVCTFNAPEAKPNKINASEVDELLREIMSPDGFIPAIKAYRSITGAGLKEAKEAIERYRNIPKFPEKKSDEGATLGDILGKVNTKERPPVNFDKFEG